MLYHSAFQYSDSTPSLSRRQLLRRCVGGVGMLGLAHMFGQETAASVATSANPLAPKLPHHTPRAKNVIFLYMPGGPSQVDMFDPKPRLIQDHGKPLPIPKPKLERTKVGNLLQSHWKFSKHGQSGIEVSELLPHVAGCVDDLCIIRSMVADNINHTGASFQLFTGEQTFSRPSLGSWLLYGLGNENNSLPGFMMICPGKALPSHGTPLYGASFLPAYYQGALVSNVSDPIANLSNARRSRQRQREQIDLIKQLNESHLRQREEDSRLSARIESYEMAFRMQSSAPEAFDLSGESRATLDLYGCDHAKTDVFARQCLLARRLVERGVRMVQVLHQTSSHTNKEFIWDQHHNLQPHLSNNCEAVDQPIAGLLRDLKARGLLDDTLVVWGGEFGRTPTAEGTNGREHHPFGFTMWLAGGGVKPGNVYGATDEFGWYAVENPVHIHDLHATILYLLGIDHTRLTYRYGGRDHRLTDVYGRIVQEIIA